jgi:hypothetical protein
MKNVVTNEEGYCVSLNYLVFLQERELNVVLMDHSYSKPWNWRPENTYAKPTKTLFVQSSAALAQTGLSS